MEEWRDIFTSGLPCYDTILQSGRWVQMFWRNIHFQLPDWWRLMKMETKFGTHLPDYNLVSWPIKEDNMISDGIFVCIQYITIVHNTRKLHIHFLWYAVKLPRNLRNCKCVKIPASEVFLSILIMLNYMWVILPWFQYLNYTVSNGKMTDE